MKKFLFFNMNFLAFDLSFKVFMMNVCVQFYYSM